MDKSKIIELLKGQDQQHVRNFANYIVGLYNELDGNNKPVNYFLHTRKEEDVAEAYLKVAKEGMKIDGKHIKLTKNGVSWDYVAYKNKMLLIYPESKIDIELIFEGDKFSYKKTNGQITYELEVEDAFASKKDDKVVGGFCIIKNRRGEFITRLTTEEIEKHRALAIDSFYWANWFQEMCRKTVIKKACKEHFEDDFKGVDEMDNENYDLSNSPTLNTTWKTEIDAITNLDDLATYYKANESSGADFVKYITKRKNQIKEEQKQRQEAQQARLDELKKKIDGISSLTVLKTVYDQVNNEFKGNMPEDIADYFKEKEKAIKPAKKTAKPKAKKRGRPAKKKK